MLVLTRATGRITARKSFVRIRSSRGMWKPTRKISRSSGTRFRKIWVSSSRANGHVPCRIFYPGTEYNIALEDGQVTPGTTIQLEKFDPEEDSQRWKFRALTKTKDDSGNTVLTPEKGVHIASQYYDDLFFPQQDVRWLPAFLKRSLTEGGKCWACQTHYTINSLFYWFRMVLPESVGLCLLALGEKMDSDDAIRLFVPALRVIRYTKHRSKLTPILRSRLARNRSRSWATKICGFLGTGDSPFLRVTTRRKRRGVSIHIHSDRT